MIFGKLQSKAKQSTSPCSITHKTFAHKLTGVVVCFFFFSFHRKPTTTPLYFVIGRPIFYYKSFANIYHDYLFGRTDTTIPCHLKIASFSCSFLLRCAVCIFTFSTKHTHHWKYLWKRTEKFLANGPTKFAMEKPRQLCIKRTPKSGFGNLFAFKTTCY